MQLTGMSMTVLVQEPLVCDGHLFPPPTPLLGSDFGCHLFVFAFSRHGEFGVCAGIFLLHCMGLDV